MLNCCHNFHSANRILQYESINIKLKIQTLRISLVVQRVRVHLPMPGTRIQFLILEDPTCWGANKPMGHSYWASALEPKAAATEPMCSRACAPQVKPPKRDAHTQRAAPVSGSSRKAYTAMKMRTTKHKLIRLYFSKYQNGLNKGGASLICLTDKSRSLTSSTG